MMSPDKIDAVLALRRNGKLLLGRDRIKLLEAVARAGSITRAARTEGFSYKAAWDAVSGINSLSASPAIRTRSGGRLGGGVEITREGRRLIAMFRRLEERLADISSNLAEDATNDAEELLLWNAGLKVSTRNVFRTEVSKV